jgi:hypothetical protein
MVASSPPLGAGDPTGLRQTTVPVGPGSTICFITDGVIDARRDERTLGLPRVERMVRDMGEDATAERLVAEVAREADSMPDDVAVAMLHVEGGAPSASTLRVEEIEVTREELEGDRLRRFLEGAGVAPDEIPGVLEDARPRAAKDGAAVLRVRRAEGRSGVDVLPARHASAPGGELAALRSIS